MDLINVLKKQWDRTAAVVLAVVGAIQLIVGWVGVSGTAVLSEQAPYIVSGGMTGIFCLGLGATLWISADLRDEWRKLDRIEQALAGGVLRWAENGSSQAAAPRSVDATPDGASDPLRNGRSGQPSTAGRAQAVAAPEHA